MPWFKVDDKLHDHRKTRKALRSVGKRRDAAAMGLWALAGSWSADNLTDGFVPADELYRWDDNADALAARLVDAGLWFTDEHRGEDGFRFHDWDVRNPDASSVLAKRAAESAGGHRGNHLRWHVGRGVTVPDCDLCATPPPESGTRSGRRRTTRVAPESSRPGPTQPTAAAAVLDPTIAVLADKLRAHTPLRGLRFDTLNPDQVARLRALVELHGDEPLVAVAISTCRTPAPTHASAFLGTWESLPPPGRPLHVVRPRYCDIHNTKLTPAGVCSSCASDQKAGTR